MIGELGISGDKGKAVYLEADTIKVEDAKPYAYKDNETNSRTNKQAFGGVVGLASQGTTSKISNFTINTGNGEITKGGRSNRLRRSWQCNRIVWQNRSFECQVCKVLECRPDHRRPG